ncbi:MAG: hypothetical protein HOW73_48300 [Polyangiaceae bacterium]|nr:hypothetical protein [Polyangiaceae bacterium]
MIELLGAAGQDGTLDRSLDKQLDSPPWVVASVRLIFSMGALAFGQERTFRPTFVTNTSVRQAAFLTSDATVRIHPDLFTNMASSMPAAEEQVAFTLGVLAHEYGHYADKQLFLYDRLISAVPELRAQSLSRVHKKELFADSVAGCLLARMDQVSDPLARFYASGATRASDSHPAADLRLIALKHGWARCASNRQFPTAIESMF